MERKYVALLNEGGSKASAFIAKAMAETKLRNGNYVPPFTDVAGVDFDKAKMKKKSGFIDKHFGEKPVMWKGLIRPPPPTDEETKKAVEDAKRRVKLFEKESEKFGEAMEEGDKKITTKIVRKVLKEVHTASPYTETTHLGVLKLLGVKPSFVRTYDKEAPFKDEFYTSYAEFKKVYDSYGTPAEDVEETLRFTTKKETKAERSTRLYRERRMRQLQKRAEKKAKKEADAEVERGETKEERVRRLNRERQRKFRAKRKAEKEKEDEGDEEVEVEIPEMAEEVEETKEERVRRLNRERQRRFRERRKAEVG